MPENTKVRRRNRGVPYDVMDKAVSKMSDEYPDAEKLVPVWHTSTIYVEVWKAGRADVIRVCDDQGDEL